MPKPPPKPDAHPFTAAELREVEPVLIKLQEACDERRERLLVLEPGEARLLRKLLRHLQHRPNPPR